MHITLTNIQIFCDIVSKIIFIIGTCYAVVLFRYKVSFDERNVYIENANKIKTVLSILVQRGNITAGDVEIVREAYQEALFTMNKDICDYINEILDLLFALEAVQGELIDKHLMDPETRKKYTQQQRDIKLKLNEKGKNIFKIYRKHIVSERMDEFKSVISSAKDKALPFLKEKKRAD